MNLFLNKALSIGKERLQCHPTYFQTPPPETSEKVWSQRSRVKTTKKKEDKLKELLGLLWLSFTQPSELVLSSRMGRMVLQNLIMEGVESSKNVPKTVGQRV